LIILLLPRAGARFGDRAKIAEREANCDKAAHDAADLGFGVIDRLNQSTASSYASGRSAPHPTLDWRKYSIQVGSPLPRAVFGPSLLSRAKTLETSSQDKRAKHLSQAAIVNVRRGPICARSGGHIRIDLHDSQAEPFYLKGQAAQKLNSAGRWRSRTPKISAATKPNK
jgi:hypothetical protein